jgi:hypothetical protein
MANELIQFDNLRAVLEEFAQEFKDQYRAGLLSHGRFTQYGEDRLVDSVDANQVQAMIREGDEAWTVTINLNEYWKYVENDTRPHWPPPSAILRWVEIKPVLPHPDANGRIPSPRSLAYLIGRKISREGTTGSHDFKTAQETTIERLRVRIRVAMVRDVQNYVRQVLAR